jgi:hypothetical protein
MRFGTGIATSVSSVKLLMTAPQAFGAYFFAEDSDRDGEFPEVALGRASVSASSNLFNSLASRSESGSFTAYCSRSSAPMPVRMARK